MTPILILCGVAAAFMFCLFFIIPNLDRPSAKGNAANHGHRSAPAQAHGQKKAAA